MQQVIVDANAIILPQEFADIIGTERVMIREISDGLILTPVPNIKRGLRGRLKGKGLSTERLFEMKRKDMELEG